MAHARELFPKENELNTIQELSSDASTDGQEDDPPFRSFLNIEMEHRIRAMRDIYKNDVEQTHTVNKSQLLQKRHEIQQEADKMKLLLDFNKTALQQLEEQREATANTLQQTMTHVKSLRQQMTEQQNVQSLSLTKTAMHQLLDDLKRNN